MGSLPGHDPVEAARIVVDELGDFPHLPELPQRGVGADMVGRTGALLVDLHLDLQPAGWRLVTHSGADLRRARTLLHHDLDALEEVAGTYAGPLKLQAAGPWTLAAALETVRGGKALADAGAVRDVADSLAEGLTEHLRGLLRRVPAARPVVQLDEPSLPAVLDGRVPTASGFARIPAVPEPDATEVLRRVVDAIEAAGAVPAVHCCAAGVPVTLLREAGARAVSLDASLLAGRDDDAVGEAVEAGLGLWAGLVPSTDPSTDVSTDPSVSSSTGPGMSPVADTVSGVRALWSRLGFAPETLADVVVVTPTCGLAGASPRYARRALARCREAARVLDEDPDGAVGRGTGPDGPSS